ncbi:MAG: aspartate carbamoyltransferase catalytic subunit [Alphaproteobacteria bacterium]|nr:aspartate carbamoyltransferase catalytic subunit [Alphaproteobacteria bacterium]
MDRDSNLHDFRSPRASFLQNGLLGIDQFSPADIPDIHRLFDLADIYFEKNRQGDKKSDILNGYTQVNLFFENSTRTLTSFELAGKRLGADVVGMDVTTSSISKGETLQDTVSTLNAMHPDLLVVRHSESGGVKKLDEKVACAVINAGDGTNEHPTQALLDAMVMRRHLSKLDNLRIAICGDIAHSRVARSNILLLTLLGAQVNVIAPASLLPENIETIGVTTFTDMKAGLAECDIIMALRLQKERMAQSLMPSAEEYFTHYGLDEEKLSYAKPEALIMHPGPMNRGVEIASTIADHPTRSLISEQVEAGVALRQAILVTIIEAHKAAKDKAAKGDNVISLEPV